MQRVKDRRWSAINDLIGVEPKFKVMCDCCILNDFREMFSTGLGVLRILKVIAQRMYEGKYDMFVRQSSLGRNSNVSDRAYANNMFYKCNECDRQKLYGVPISEDYYKILLAKREGEHVYTPVEAWLKDPDLRSQLKGLGYI